MATRHHRLAEFGGQGEPPAGAPIELLCEDHAGTYAVPYPCHWVGGVWRVIKSGAQIEATVVGWRII